MLELTLDLSRKHVKAALLFKKTSSASSCCCGLRWVRSKSLCQSFSGTFLESGTDFQVKNISPADDKKPILLSDGSYLSFTDEVAKLYPTATVEHSSSSSLSAAAETVPTTGWETRPKCPCRPIKEFQFLREDGEPMILTPAKAKTWVGKKRPPTVSPSSTFSYN